MGRPEDTFSGRILRSGGRGPRGFLPSASSLRATVRLPLDRLPTPGPSLGGIPFQEVLDEGRDATAHLVWKTLRAADLRARVDRAGGSEREAVFRPDAYLSHLRALRSGGIDERFEGALLAAAGLLRKGGPSREVSAATLVRLALRAEAAERERTALACFEAAARLAPGDPERSLLAGRAARNLSEWSRAERWLERSVLLARRTERWDCYVRALDARGILEFRRGRLGGARTSLTRALNRARREGLGESRGMAAHDLITVELEQGMLRGRSRLPEEVKERAESLAREAFECYGPLYHMLYALAHDAAQILALRGRFHEALPVFRAGVDRAHTPERRAIGWAGVAWSAAHLGREALYREAMREVERAVEGQLLPARILVEVAEGAAQMGEWERALRINGVGGVLAREQGESKALLDLDEQREWLAAAGTDAPVPPAAPSAAPRPWVRDLVAALRVERPAAGQAA